MARPTRFAPEVRERAIRMVLEHQGASRFAVDGDRIDRGEEGLLGGDLAEVGPPS